MHGTYGAGRSPPIKIGDRSGGKSVAEVRRVVVETSAGWFAEICKRLLPREKPGHALVVDTGFDLRDCQRYAAGDVKPPGWFVCSLLRSRNGWVWLAAFMDGASPDWWVEIQRARRIAEAIRESDRT